jgi:hypothetical protein
MFCTTHRDATSQTSWAHTKSKLNRSDADPLSLRPARNPHEDNLRRDEPNPMSDRHFFKLNSLRTAATLSLVTKPPNMMIAHVF